MARGKINVKSLAVSAMLMAMSVVIGIFCKTVLNFADGLFRITFENLPIILSGIIYGPLIGGIVGAGSDLVSYLLSAQAYPPNLIVTLGATMVGVVSGAVARYIVKRGGTTQIICSGAMSHIVGSMIIKPIGLYQFYSWLVLWRIPLYLIIMPIEVLILCLLYKNNAIRRLIEKTRGDAQKKQREDRCVAEDVPTDEGGKEEVKRMTYDEAIDYIHGISWTFCKPGLDRIERLCERLGHPERGLKFIHVAGTNGKGSFSSMLSEILLAAGYKVGLYTSPYIVEFGERIRYLGENISEDMLAEVTEYVKPIADSMEDKPTEFELICAIAFEYYKRVGAEVVVLEAGLGGRLDSTNIIRNPLLSVITGIALDHTAILGDTVEKIATEKAGIIKDNAPVLYGGEDDVARAVIRGVACERGSDFSDVDYSALNIKSASLDGTVFDYKEHEDVKIALLGMYQPRNAAVVLEAVDTLRKSGMEISEEAVKQGLLRARWLARFEIVSREPLIIFDGAHNPQGIEGAVSSIERYFDEKVYALTGVLADKDYEKIALTLSRVAERAYTITPDNPRALSAENYAEVLRARGIEAYPYGSIAEAVESAYDAAKSAGKPLVCLGSLYTYGDVIKAIKKKEGI